ncbi:hypothetical protein D9M68_987290 [compost metagenome]
MSGGMPWPSSLIESSTACSSFWRISTSTVPLWSWGKPCLSALLTSSLTISPHGMASLIGSLTSVERMSMCTCLERAPYDSVSRGRSSPRNRWKSTCAKFCDW